MAVQTTDLIPFTISARLIRKCKSIAAVCADGDAPSGDVV
jgi:hypothetical protein